MTRRVCPPPRPAAGPGETSEQSASVGAGKTASSGYAVPSNARSVSVVAETGLNLPFRLVLVDPSGLTLATADSANGMATISQPVNGGGTYVIKVINLGLGPLEMWTTGTPHLSR